MRPDGTPTTPAEGMRIMAALLDVWDGPGASTEAQDDLRRWADEVEALALKVHLIESLLDGLLMGSLDGAPLRSDGEVLEEIATILTYSSVEGYMRESFRRTIEKLMVGDPTQPWGPQGISEPEPPTFGDRLGAWTYRARLAFDRPWWWVRDNLVPRQFCAHCLMPFWTVVPWRRFHCGHPACQAAARADTDD